jgi:hypothetical protein
VNNSKKAEASSNFSSYQIKTDNDFVVILRTKEARKKVVFHERP